MSKLMTDETAETIGKHKLHYAWIILITAMVLNVVSRADAASFGVFIDPLVKNFGWSRGEVSFAYSLSFLAGIPAVVGMGWLGDRYGARTLMIIASLIIASGTILLGTISQLWQFYMFYGLFVGSLGNAAFTVLLPVTLTRWFHQKLGVAMGMYWAALGMGPLIFAPLFRWLIENRGWRFTFITMGIILGGVLVLTASFIRGKPQEKGLLAYGAKPSQGSGATQSTAAPAPKGALRAIAAQPTVWYLAAVHHLGCIGHSIILAHVVSMATSQGIPGVMAAGVLSTIAGASILSRFLFSVFTEKLGGRTLLTIALIAQGTPVLILFWAHGPWVFYLFAVVFGLSYGGEMVGFPIINRQLFGAEAPLNSIYSFEMVGASTGMALGGWLGGALFDLTGTYNWPIMASIMATYLGIPLALILPRHKKQPVVATAAPSRV